MIWMSGWMFCGTASHVSLKMEVTAEYTKALIRAHFFLLHLKKANCFSGPTEFKIHSLMLQPDITFPTHYNQSALSGSHFTWLVFHSNLSL